MAGQFLNFLSVFSYVAAAFLLILAVVFWFTLKIPAAFRPEDKKVAGIIQKLDDTMLIHTDETIAS